MHSHNAEESWYTFYVWEGNSLIKKTKPEVSYCCCWVAKSCLTLCNPICTIVHQASLSLGFPRQEYWSGLPFPSPRDFPNPGIEAGSPALQADSLPSEQRNQLLLHLKTSKQTQNLNSSNVHVQMRLKVVVGRKRRLWNKLKWESPRRGTSNTSLLPWGENCQNGIILSGQKKRSFQKPELEYKGKLSRVAVVPQMFLVLKFGVYKSGPCSSQHMERLQFVLWTLTPWRTVSRYCPNDVHWPLTNMLIANHMLARWMQCRNLPFISWVLWVSWGSDRGGGRMHILVSLEIVKKNEVWQSLLTKASARISSLLVFRKKTGKKEMIMHLVPSTHPFPSQGMTPQTSKPSLVKVPV